MKEAISCLVCFLERGVFFSFATEISARLRLGGGEGEEVRVEPHEALTEPRRHSEFGPILALHTQEWTTVGLLSSYIMGFRVPGSRVFAF